MNRPTRNIPEWNPAPHAEYGHSRAARLEENVDAAEIVLMAQEIARIDAIAPKGVAAGLRYNAAMTTLLNGRTMCKGV